jgi:mercuric ion transport protein
MAVTTRVADKIGVVGTVMGSFSCVACFPAAAGIGAAIGLGFLSRWEGVSVRYVIPAFALLVLIANLAGWLVHRQVYRAVSGAVGPILALVGAFGLMGVFGMTHGFLPAGIARGVFYAGLIVMIVVAVWDLVRPANRRCRPRGFAPSNEGR